MRTLALTVLIASALGGCASGPTTRPACAAGETRAEVAQLFFGRNIGQSLGVSDEDFRRFLDEEVTPRFPDGLTVVDAQGQWRDGQALVREPSKLLTVLLPGHTDDRSKLRLIVEVYKARFKQQAVLTTVTATCSHL
jgi:hypothetical protein